MLFVAINPMFYLSATSNYMTYIVLDFEVLGKHIYPIISF